MDWELMDSLGGDGWMDVRGEVMHGWMKKAHYKSQL